MKLSPQVAGEKLENAGKFAAAARMFRKAAAWAGGHTFAAMMEARAERCEEKAAEDRGALSAFKKENPGVSR